METFTDHLWASIAPIYEAILQHPFVAGLTDGTLPEERFRFYVVQDAHYLRGFARALAAAASKAPRDAWCELLSEHARDTLVVERALHDAYFSEWGLSAEGVYATPVAPTTLAYTSYLLRRAHGGGFEEALAALLPCDWIYVMVGRELEGQGSPKPLYQAWIDAYASDAFWDLVQEMIAMLDAAVEGLGDARRAALGRHFATASRYEWMFWDMAWRVERWPV